MRRARPRLLALRGARSALALPAWVIGFGMLGVGALARDIGIPFWAAVLSTPLIWAGPAQFVLFGGFATGASALSVALAVSLTSMRLLPMGLSLLPLVQPRGAGWALRMFLAHFVVVSTWAEGLRSLPPMRRGDRMPWFLGFSVTCMAVSTALTALGFWASGGLPPFLTAGFLFVTPLFFALSLVAGARRVVDVAAIVAGVLLLPLMSHLAGPEFDLLLTGLIGGTAAWALHRWLP